MRKIIVGENVTLDGVMEAPEKWSFPYQTEETGKSIADVMSRCDAMLLGRVTYQTFEAAFAGQNEGIGGYLNGVPKYVVSSTMKRADWNNSTLISGSVVEQIVALKQQSGRDIAVNGSRTLIQTLLQHDLIDELALLVYPVLGSGMRLFGDGLDPLAWKLVESTPTSSGVIILRYQRDRAA